MSSRFPASILAAAALALTLTACDREERHSRAKPLGETVPAGLSPGMLYAGSQPGTAAVDPRAALYKNNAPALAEGQRLFSWMNCVGCHAHGGGGMGPPLMDSQWRYGGSIPQIAATIVEGRPNGMPSFRGKIVDTQVWQLVAFVQSMNGQSSLGSLPGRSDHLNGGTPENGRTAETPQQTGSPR